MMEIKCTGPWGRTSWGNTVVVTGDQNHRREREPEL